MVKNNHYELSKCTFTTWVNKALDVMWKCSIILFLHRKECKKSYIWSRNYFRWTYKWSTLLLDSYNHNSRGFVSCKSIVLASFTQKENKRQRTMLVDYNKSLITTFNEYANVLPQKVVDKKVAKEIKK